MLWFGFQLQLLSGVLRGAIKLTVRFMFMVTVSVALMVMDTVYSYKCDYAHLQS